MAGNVLPIADGASSISTLLQAHREQILEVARRHHAVNVRVFGSVARGESTATSDIDFLVDFEVGSSLFDVLHLTDDLRDLLGCEVDVVSAGGLKPRDSRIRSEAAAL